MAPGSFSPCCVLSIKESNVILVSHADFVGIVVHTKRRTGIQYPTSQRAAIITGFGIAKEGYGYTSDHESLLAEQDSTSKRKNKERGLPCCAVADDSERSFHVFITRDRDWISS